MRKRDKKCNKATPDEPKRERRMSILLSEDEQQIVDRYLDKYKITNKSRWLRETILMFIHKNMEEDYPTLFGVRRMLDDSYFMKQALIEAVKAGERGEVPVGAVVVCKERIIARAHNLTETLNDVTAHAEMQAITAAANVLGGKYLNECTLYVTVEPCVMCAGAIAWAQTGKLVFGAEDDKRGYQRYAPQALHPKTVVVKGILADECAGLMKDFFAAKRR